MFHAFFSHIFSLASNIARLGEKTQCHRGTHSFLKLKRSSFEDKLKFLWEIDFPTEKDPEVALSVTEFL